MRILLLLLLLAPAASALDPDAPGAPALKARDAVELLPPAARFELRQMYFKYRDQVAKRMEQGWEAGVLNDAVIEDVDEPFQPARLLEEAEKKRVAELEKMQAAMAKLPRESLEYDKAFKRVQDRKDALEDLRKKKARETGICRDWSDDIWFLLTKMNLRFWAVDDRQRSARPFHTGAVACAPAETPTVCLVFDPWARGKPDVVAFQAWDDKLAGGRLPADYFLHGLPEKAP